MLPLQLPISVQLQERVGSIIAGSGLVWATKVWTTNPLGILGLVLRPGVVELCTFGVLVWALAKWRRVRLGLRPLAPAIAYEIISKS